MLGAAPRIRGCSSCKPDLTGSGYCREVAQREDTASQSRRRHGGAKRANAAVPGVVTVYAHDAARLGVRPVRGPLVIGRGDECDLAIEDRRASRRHTELVVVDARWRVRDLGSHNGTYLDGERVVDAMTTGSEAVLSVGDTVFLLSADVQPLVGGAVELLDSIVIGPRLRAVWDAIARLATRARVAHLTGETGTGKEMAARHFHASSARAEQPFVAVNCSAVPTQLAERLLFGARRGAYSGADADSEGYLTAADGGTLFLDEIGELSLDVQAKLLRAIETGEVMPLGAAKPRKVDVAICSATHVDLRERVAAGSFRDDLYFRIAQSVIEIPPLRTRREDIPWLIDVTLRRVSRLTAHVSFVEAALQRPWPGNARELVNAVASLAHAAGDGERRLEATHLGDHVGRAIGSAPPVMQAPTRVAADPDSNAILDALKHARGNVTRAAQALGLHRTQLRRWLERHQVDPQTFKRRLGLLSGGGDSND